MEKLLSRIKITHNLTNDDTEFAFQDIIHNKLNEIFNINED